MIQNVYLIHESGICLMARTYSGDTTNIDLLSAYLLSISHFAKQMMGEEIREIRLERHTIVYDLQETVMLAIVTSGRKPSKKKLTSLLRRLYRAFFDQYEEHLRQQIVEPEIYRDFSEIADQILSGY